MKKIKIFNCEHLNGLEKQVNEFITGNNIGEFEIKFYPKNYPNAYYIIVLTYIK